MSTNQPSQLPEHKLELESQFILRLPEKQAEELRKAFQSGEPLAKRLAVKFDPDVRKATVHFDDMQMPAKLFDLPTIIESYKTLDRKNFYKTADISQILICKEQNDMNESAENSCDIPEDQNKNSHDKLFASVGGAGKREFLFPHGITPPLKNVRKRRFRKTLKKKYVDFSEIEKEVKRLFKFDCEAIDSRYEIVEESKDKANPSTPLNETNVPSPMSGGPAGAMSAENSQNIDLHQLFGDESSSSDESDDDDDDEDEEIKDDEDLEIDNDVVNDDDSADDEEMEVVAPEQVSVPSVPAADIAAEIAAASDLISQNDDTEEKRQELNRELEGIRDRIETHKSEMRGLDNQALRMRLQLVLDSLHEKESELKRQLEDLGSYM